LISAACNLDNVSGCLHSVVRPGLSCVCVSVCVLCVLKADRERESERESMCVCAERASEMCTSLHAYKNRMYTRTHMRAHTYHRGASETIAVPYMHTHTLHNHLLTHPPINPHTHTHKHTHTHTHSQRERERESTNAHTQRETHARTHARTHAERERDRERERDSIPPPCTDDMFPSFSSSSVTLSGCIAGACAYE
jgi:hypothetical protein